MRFEEERIGQLLKDLKKQIYTEEIELPEWFSKREYEIHLPQILTGKTVEFCVRTGKEGEWDAVNPQFAVWVNGKLRQSFDVNHRNICLTEKGSIGEVFTVRFSHGFALDKEGVEIRCFLRGVNQEIRQCYYDLLIPYQCAVLLEPEEEDYLILIDALKKSIQELDFRKPGSELFYTGIKKASDIIKENLYEKDNTSKMVVYAVGHTHIDVAWLWTLAVTRQKAVRSFATVLELMKKYPEYQFMSSQPQLYQYVKEEAPELYEEIKEAVAMGRWEPEGAMYVEPDCNIPSGESLVRQCLYGKGFFREEFECDNKILWLPDVFGYSAALPQIMKKSGIDYFMTTKISWNETNKMPFDTFFWEGIDGTRVLTHFVPTRDYVSKTRNIKTNGEHTSEITTNYNGYIHPAQVKGAWQRYQQKELNKEVLMSYGYGDGGGGPTEEMLETAQRLKKGLPGCPAVRLTHAKEFFEELNKNLQGKQAPLWSGELYLEYHRGTYTSMGRNKRSNRKGEFALLNAELWSVTAQIMTEHPFQRQTVKKCWEILLRNQFHDILPGTSIEEVYEDSRNEYEQMNVMLEKVTQSAQQCIADAVGEKGSLVVFNGNSAMGNEWVQIPKETQGLQEGDILKSEGEQAVICRKEGSLCFFAKQVSPKSCRTYYLSGSRDAGNPVEEKELVPEELLESQYYQIRLNDRGQIIEFYDRQADRQILQTGRKGNVLVTYEDKPHDFDAWNLYAYYQEKSWEVEQLTCMKAEFQRGKLQKIRLCWNYFDSVIEQDICFYTHTKRVDFKTRIDWKEQQIFLKALFPVDVNSREAAFEIQYGHVKRPTVQNTSWDQARFEVCYQKWMDIGETGYGVSFLNDYKCGVSVRENEVGISLLKSGIYPNPRADQETHEFTYAIYPHLGDFRQAGTISESYALNNPMNVVVSSGKGGAGQKDLFAVSEENILLEAVKYSEKGENIILRLYESWNQRTEFSILIPQFVKKVFVANLLEEPEAELEIVENRCRMRINPFEIVTLLLCLELTE